MAAILETYSLCCWLVLLQVSPQPIPQAHPVFRKTVLLQPCIFSLRQPQTSLANSQQTSKPQILLTAIPTTSPGTSPADSFAFFQRQNIQTPSFSYQQPCYIISALTLSFRHSPWFLSLHSIPASESKVHKILSNCPNKQSDSDPIPTWLRRWSIIAPSPRDSSMLEHWPAGTWMCHLTFHWWLAADVVSNAGKQVAYKALEHKPCWWSYVYISCHFNCFVIAWLL